MTPKSHMENRLSWQAHVYGKVNADCLKDGHFPNGQKLTAKDAEECRRHIDHANEVLKEFGCETIKIESSPKQLELNF